MVTRGLTAWRDTLKTNVRTKLCEVFRWFLSFFCMNFSSLSILRLLCQVFCTWIYSSSLSFLENSLPWILYWSAHLTAFDFPFSFRPPTSFTEHPHGLIVNGISFPDLCFFCKNKAENPLSSDHLKFSLRLLWAFISLFLCFRGFIHSTCFSYLWLWFIEYLACLHKREKADLYKGF